MATEEVKPAPLEEVEVPVEELLIPTSKPTDGDYQSSEHLQRAHNAEVFAKSQEKERKAATTEREKVVGALDKYIEQHSSTTKVRALAVKNSRTNELQMDISADLVEMLQKIKKSLR